jgi:alpha-galactosidase
LMQGDTAVCLFNRNDDAKNTEIRWSDYHLSSGHSMRDLWKHEDLGTSSDIFKITVAKHGIVLLRLHAK